MDDAEKEYILHMLVYVVASLSFTGSILIIYFSLKLAGTQKLSETLVDVDSSHAACCVVRRDENVCVSSDHVCCCVRRVLRCVSRLIFVCDV